MLNTTDAYENTIKYIEEQESTDVSYVKVGENNKNLIVSFASNQHDGFERKSSLMKLRFERNDFDILYLRNRRKWYLGVLNGIGKNINHTIAFFKKEFSKYDKVLCTGYSAGGYASLLFGSLLNVNLVIASSAQTDLQYVKNKLNHFELIKQKNQHPVTWNKYNKISNVLNDDVSYKIFYAGDEFYDKKNKELEFENKSSPSIGPIILHGDYHYNQIKHFPNVSKLESGLHIPLLIKKFLEGTPF